MMLFGFFLGFLAGIACVAIILLHQVTKLEKKHVLREKEDIDKMIDEIAKIKTVKAKFVEINEITDEQLELIAHVERPSASASHSRHKNGIVQRIKDLEERKLELFHEILDTGIDPVITIYIDGEEKKIRMSEAVKLREEQIDDYDNNTDSKSPRGNVSHLKLVTDEEQVDEPNPSNPTIH